MNPQSPAANERELMLLIEELCDRFEASWQSGNQPRIEDLLEDVGESARARLLRDLLPLDLEYRRDRGERPTTSEYLVRFSLYKDAVQSVFQNASVAREPRDEPGSTVNRADNTPGHSADRNLLLGIIAHQMDLVDSDSLIRAMNAWVLEKSKPLGKILVQQGALTADTHELLEALVAKHVEQHQGDVERSLASVGGLASMREQLDKIGAVDVQASLSRVSINEVLQTVSHQPTTNDPTSSAPRFRVVRPHAKGGIGEIFIAEDHELSREVALKELQLCQAYNPDSRARFLLEAEITGRLEHPGIVPVYGLGHYADGRPYYAMRLIQGESLKDAISSFHDGRAKRSATQERLELHKLLGRFVDVCNAVEYAHSRGILHRDLKPGNVMLGKYGETLVVDWGLAKSGKRTDSAVHVNETTLKVSSNSGSTPTRMGAVFGTPAYMSPEQGRGDLEQLGPKSDVYSLGATLYHLLTGRPAFVAEQMDVLLKNIQANSFPRPREVNAEIPAALDAICTRAMALKPDDRYMSPMALAADIENWLADQAVLAWREPVHERIRRWMRGHQTLVSGVAVAMIVAMVSLATGIVLLNASRQREQLARQYAQQSHLEAEGSFRQARDAVDHFYTQVSEDTLLEEPGMQPLRKQLLTQALAYYEAFLQQRADDRSLKAEVAAAWFRVGFIREVLGSANDAVEAYDSAREIQAALVALAPDDVSRQADLGDTINATGRAQQRMSQFEAAAAAYDEAFVLREKIVDKAPGESEYQRKLASSYMNLGIISRLLGEVEVGYAKLDRAQQIRQHQLSIVHHLKTRRDLGMGYYNVAVFRLMDGNGEAGQQSLNLAVEAFQQVLAENPRDFPTQQRLATCYRMLADRLLAVPDLPQAIEHYNDARSILDVLAIRNPDIPEFSAALAAVQLNLSEAARRHGQPQAAMSELQGAIELFAALATSYQEIPDYRRNLAISLRAMAAIQTDQGSLDEASQNLRAAKSLLEGLLKELPQDLELQRQLTEIGKLIGASDPELKD